ncbi:sulfotransferase 1C3-like [Glandiceps talaboti]
MSSVEVGQPYHYNGVYFLSNLFPKSTLENLEGFEIREDDVFVSTYPRSGTTLTQQIVRLIVNHDGDTKLISNTDIRESFPFLEVSPLNKDQPNYKIIESMPSPRLIKTHLPVELAPKQIFEKKPKIVYVLRHPKDVLVSYYNFCIPFYPDKSFHEFLDDFLQGEVIHGSWFAHTKGWLPHCKDDNVIFLKYDDIVKDLEGTISRLALFLLQRPLSPSKITEITELCRFGCMVKNPNVNKRTLSDGNQHHTIMRKGIPGDWKNVLTVADSERIDDVYKKEMEGLDITF